MEHVSVLRKDGYTQDYYPYNGVILSATLQYESTTDLLALALKVKLDDIPSFITHISGDNGRRGFSRAEFFQFRLAGLFKVLDVSSTVQMNDKAFRGYLLYEDGSEGPMPLMGFGAFDGSEPFYLPNSFDEFAQQQMILA